MKDERLAELMALPVEQREDEKWEFIDAGLCFICGKPMLDGQAFNGLHQVHWDCRPLTTDSTNMLLSTENGQKRLKEAEESLRRLEDRLEELARSAEGFTRSAQTFGLSAEEAARNLKTAGKLGMTGQQAQRGFRSAAKVLAKPAKKEGDK